jgi:hypothetical protein
MSNVMDNVFKYRERQAGGLPFPVDWSVFIAAP